MANKQAIELLASLRERKVQLSCDKDVLTYKAPKGVLSAADIQSIRNYKASLLELLKHERKDRYSTPLEPRTTNGPVAASFAQQGLWFLDRMYGSTAYHIPTTVRLKGALDAAALRGAMEELVRRHEALRTVFTEVDGQVLQWVQEPWRFALPLVDLSGLDFDSRGQELRRLSQREIEAKFDLSQGPMIRALVLRETADSHVLVVTVHHIVGDVGSMGIMLHELGVLYAAAREGRGNPLQPLRIQYADYSQWQQQRYQGQALTELLDYWRTQLLDAPLLELPLDCPFPQTRSYRASVHEFTLSADSGAALMDLSRACSATSHMAALAAFQVLLWRLSGQRDIVIASPVLGRSVPESQLMIGCFINVVLIRVRVEEGLSFRQLLMRVKEVTLDAYEHQDLPFDRLIAQLQTDRGGAAVALSRVSFSFNQTSAQSGAGLDLPGLLVEQFSLEQSAPVKNDLTWAMLQNPQGLSGSIIYPVDLFDSRTIQQFARRFQRLVEQVTAQPDQPLAEIDLTVPKLRTQDSAVRRLSIHQQMMWIDLQLHPDKASYYNIADYVEIAGPIDPVLFEQAIQQVVQRCAALRLRFQVDQNGIPQQEILPRREVQVQVCDLRSERDPIAAALAWIARWRAQPLDILTDVPFRFCLLQLSSELTYWYMHYHHFVMDGVGSTLLRGRVARVYSALVRGEKIELPCDAANYLEYLHLDSEYRYSPRRLTDAQYWLKNLDRSSAVTLSAWARVPAANEPLRVGERVSEPTMRALKARAAEFGTSIGRLLIAGVALYLHKVTGKARVCVGLPTHGRFDECAFDLAGACANISPVLSVIGPNESVRSFVESTLPRLKATLKHGRYAYEDIRRLFGLSSSDEALFNVTINVIPFASAADYFAGARGTTRTRASYERDMIIWVFYSTDADELWVVIDANPGLYEAWELESHLNRLDAFLERLSRADPGDAVCNLPAMSPDERRQSLERFNDTRISSSHEGLIHEMFEEQVRCNPRSIALVHQDIELTYDELNRRANQLAHHLRTCAVGPDRLVAVCVDRSVEMVIALLGILKAGGAYVPLDPSYPTERLKYMLEAAVPALVLTQEKFVNRLPQDGCGTIALDSQWSLIAQCADGNIPRSQSGLLADHLAYMIFTSGSTGLPKGAGVAHRGVSNLVQWYLREYGFTSADRILIVSSFSFDLTQKNFFAALVRGGQLHLATEPFDPLHIGQQIAAADITTLNLSPSAFYAITDGDAKLLPLLSSLRRVVLGGEPINLARIGELEAACPGLYLINSYGPTECSDVTTAYRLPRGWQSRQQDGVPLGRPIANTRVYILDERREPVPMGMGGEIYIAGDGVGRGYLNSAALTADRFGPNPFEPGRRMYRTGDLGRWRADGNIEYFGRNDHQVKIRGYRIELGEIEALLSQHPQIKQAAVLAREDTPGEKCLVGYVTPREAADISVLELQAYLEQRLPDYMVPRVFVTLANWPLTPSGKLDRKALPPPEAGRLSRASFHPPEGRIEAVVAGIWQEVLHVERVGRSDNFFELGGHSLLAVVLVNRLKAQGFALPISVVFQKPTLSALSAYIAAISLQTPADPGLLELQSAGTDIALFVVHDVITGEAFHMQCLAERLPYTVYGLLLDPTAAALTSIEAIASHHVNTIRRRQARGPYRLLGHSHGGLIAYEIANQLQQAGEPVDFLGLMDTYRPTAANDLSGQISEVLALLIFLRERFRSLQASELTEFEKLDDVEKVLRRGQELGLLPSELTLPQVRAWARNSVRLINAGFKYRPPPPASRMHLFTAGNEGHADPSLGWRDLAGAWLELEVIGGTHMSMLQMPYAQRIAEIIGAELSGAEASESDVMQEVNHLLGQARELEQIAQP